MLSPLISTQPYPLSLSLSLSLLIRLTCKGFKLSKYLLQVSSNLGIGNLGNLDCKEKVFPVSNSECLLLSAIPPVSNEIVAALNVASEGFESVDGMFRE